MARSIGIRATPLFLSTQAYVVRSFWVSSCNAFSFSMRFLARVSSKSLLRGDGPITASTMRPNKTKRNTTPSHVENGVRE